ncbi:MAG TPA: hypothetical protein VFV38_14135 [Ktedonobacteraceae bacterium]|nr:hypothetical protein [Ktedonobacteraceae bacterium]
MFRVQKKDWVLAFGLSALVTGFMIYTSSVAIFCYLVAILSIFMAVCWFFDDREKGIEVPQAKEQERAVAWYKHEKYRILLSLLLIPLVFFYLGLLSLNVVIPHVIFSVVVFLCFCLLYGLSLLVFVCARFCVLQARNKHK